MSYKMPTWLKIAIALTVIAFLVFAFAGKLAAAHILLLGGAAAFFYIAEKAHQSGTVSGGSSGSPTIASSSAKRPYLKIPQTWFGIVCVVAEIFLIWNTISNK